MKKHIFFDMDGTLTRSRTEITREMRLRVFELIDSGLDVVVVSGATDEQILRQIGADLYEHVGILAQNGNVAYSPIGTRMWEHKMNAQQKREVLDFIRRLGAGDDPDLIQDRGCQISYSAIGHNAPLPKKEAYDPGGKWRKSQLDGHKYTVMTLGRIGIKAAVGGTTCIDFYIHSKGENVGEYVQKLGWKKEECVYIGDALFEGGNDFSVCGVIPTLEVRNPKETEEAITAILDS